MLYNVHMYHPSSGVRNFSSVKVKSAKKCAMNRLQKRNQRLIRNALTKTRLITSIPVAEGRAIDLECLEWEDYWDYCLPLREELQWLKKAWTLFIESGHSIERQGDYVQAYFNLLHVGLDCFCRGEIDLNSLRKIIAFETFQVSGEHGPLAAGIFNVRNPVYLLSRLAHPCAPDDPKYLPLVCPLDHASETPQLYGHYRRISLHGRRGIQLFVYLPIESHAQTLSHLLIGRLFASLTPKTDPWVHERSRFRFHIESVPFQEVSGLFRRKENDCPLETDVLQPGKLIRDRRLKKIDHSIKRLMIQGGTAFRQFSLSDYFKAIYAVVGGKVSQENNVIYLPIRRFDGNALVLPSGQSLIARLMAMADCIVVEDADLSPSGLQEHFDCFGLHDLRITDMTRLAKMRGASVCIIDKKP